MSNQTDTGNLTNGTPGLGRRRVDMTQGPLLRNIFYLSWPIVCSSLLQVMVSIADIKMVGTLGHEQIAAVGISRSVVFILMAMAMAVATGVQVLVAQYAGRGDSEGMDRTVKQGLIASAAITLGLVTPLGVLFSGWIMARMGASEQVMAHGVPYMQILFGGILFMILSFVITASLQGAGDTITPLVLLLFANAVNILVNYLFIFGVGPFPRMGVAGAAVGTVAARFLSGVIGILILTSGRFAVKLRWRRSWAVRWELVHRILFIGVPAGLQHIVRNLAFMVMLKILSLTAAGMYAVSAFTVAQQIQMVTGMVGLALMGAAMTAVGQNVGAGNFRRAAASAWTSVAIAVSISAAAAATYGLLRFRLIALFNADPEVVRIGGQALMVLAFAEPFLTAGMSLSGALRGAGDTYSPLYISFFTISFIGPVISYVLAIVMGMETLGVWLGLACAQVAHCLLIARKFRQGRWRQLRMLDG